MKSAVLIAFVLACVGPITAAFARELNDPDAGFSMTIPDEYIYKPELIDAANVYSFVKPDQTDEAGTVIFLKHLDFQSLQVQPPLSPDTVVAYSINWHGSKLNVLESSARMKGVTVISERVRVHVRDGAIEVIVLGGRDKKQQLLALQLEIVSTLKFLPPAASALQASSTESPNSTASQSSVQPPPPASPPADSDTSSDNAQAATATAVRTVWIERLQRAGQLAKTFFQQFGIQLFGVYALSVLVLGRVFGAKLNFIAYARLGVIAVVPPLLLNVGLGLENFILPYHWIPFGILEFLILAPALRVYAAPHPLTSYYKPRRWFRRGKPSLPPIAAADLSINSARPGFSNTQWGAAEQEAADRINADAQMTDYDKLIYMNALKALTKTDMAILERVAANTTLPVAELAQVIPEPRDEESLGGLISSLRRLEAHGLLLATIPQRKTKLNKYKADSDIAIHPWLTKEATSLPRGQKLVQLLKCGATVFSRDQAGAQNGLLETGPNSIQLAHH